jgi:hypothetical protein
MRGSSKTFTLTLSRQGRGNLKYKLQPKSSSKNPSRFFSFSYGNFHYNKESFHIFQKKINDPKARPQVSKLFLFYFRHSCESRNPETNWIPHQVRNDTERIDPHRSLPCGSRGGNDISEPRSKAGNRKFKLFL